MATPVSRLAAVPDSNTLARHLERQRAYFETGETRSHAFRLRQLQTLRAAIIANEDAILEALAKDLRKVRTESFVTEIGPVLAEIGYVAKNLKAWMKPQRTLPALVVMPATTKIQAEPLGVSLILGAWNYPFHLTLSPLVGAIAAGCCATIKPSELSPATSRVIADLVARTFDSKFVHVVEGDVDVSQELLALRWDQIFFTGSPKIGRVVAEAAAKHLTPTVLELGGKSPCIVDEDVDLDITARRIAWGKFINAGQTCVAPDYLFVHENLKDRLVEALGREVKRFYGDDPKTSPDFARIVSDRHYARLAKMVAESGGKIAVGGATDAAEKYVAPTVITDVPEDSPLLQEEIFGPILPVLTYRDLDEPLKYVRAREKPLALYFFGRSEKLAKRVIAETSSGGVVINDVAVHLGASTLPFGGVGESGNGRYHGRFSFDAFSHFKAVMWKPFQLDVPLRYPAYSQLAMKVFRRLFG